MTDKQSSTVVERLTELQKNLTFVDDRNLIREAVVLLSAPVEQPKHYKEQVPKFKFDTLVEHAKRQDNEIAELRAERNQLSLYEDNCVWHWQHDGADYLESLSCPIIIQPSQLRELLAGVLPVEQQGEPVAWLWRDGCMVETTAKLTEEQRSSGRWQPLYTAAPQAMRLPDRYCIMPRRLTAENGAKALLLGEFKVSVDQECYECRKLEEPLEHCEICDGTGEYALHQTISWDQIKFIYSEAVKGLALTQDQAGGPATTYAEYTTSPGESLAGIAGRQLKDESRWVEIRDLNAHAFPDMLPHDYYPVGTKLRLPA